MATRSIRRKHLFLLQFILPARNYTGIQCRENSFFAEGQILFSWLNFGLSFHYWIINFYKFYNSKESTKSMKQYKTYGK